ncbi:MAG: TonB-dependent receptor, partial [Algicola sp.]|nr:TonB-dependent receptor [Algicola sp.]
GNPELEPQKAKQFDIAYEWYFNDSSVFSATYFYKNIESYTTSSVVVEQFFNEQSGEYVDVDITTTTNGKGGTSNGLELGYQQSFGNFGIAANYTYTNADRDQATGGSTRSGFVEGASENMYNTTFYYETETYGARIMYNYRTEWYKGVSWTGADLWNDSYGQWDFSSSYQVSDNLSLTFEAVNLTDEEVVEYDGEKSRLMSIYQNGRRFLVGLNMSF